MSRAVALGGMDSAPLRPIDFTACLAEMQSMIGETVLVTLTFDERFFGGAFRSRLDRVETLPPDDVAVVLRFEHGEAIQLDPAETAVFVGGREFGAPRWLELHIASGPTLSIEGERSVNA